MLIVRSTKDPSKNKNKNIIYQTNTLRSAIYPSKNIK